MKTDIASLEQLTKIFSNKWGIQLNTYEDQYHRTDCWFEWRDVRWDVEVKRRRFASSRYSTTLINLDKFKELVKTKSILVVMFDDCWYMCKNVVDAFVSVSSVYAKTTTDFGGDYVWSDKVELDLNKFTRYDY